MRVSHRSTAARIVSSSRSASRMIMTSYGRNASAIRPGLLRTAAQAAGPCGLGRNARPEGQDARLSNREKVSDHLERPIESDPTHRLGHFHLTGATTRHELCTHEQPGADPEARTVLTRGTIVGPEVEAAMSAAKRTGLATPAR